MESTSTPSKVQAFGMLAWMALMALMDLMVLLEQQELKAQLERGE